MSPFVISKTLVWEACQRVRANRGAVGVDGEMIAEVDRDLSRNLYRIWNRMSLGGYFPPSVKAVPIPKKSGCERMLGVATVGNRIAQTVVALVLEPILEPVFHADSNGYRPGRSAHDALAITRKRCWERDWVLEYCATAPNAAGCWDLTFLASSIRGQFYRLYLIEDLFSRKIVGWEVHAEESANHASRLIERACLAEGVHRPGLLLQSDNGSP